MAMAVLGKSAMELNPVIEAGSKAFKDMGDKVENMGAIHSKELGFQRPSIELYYQTLTLPVREINFSFDGKHCLRDFGCLYVAKKTRPISPASSFQTYKVAGQSGTASFGDKRIHEGKKNFRKIHLYTSNRIDARHVLFFLFLLFTTFLR